MKLSNLSKLVTALTVATTLQLFSVSKLMATDAFRIIGLTPNNVLVRFGSDDPERVRVTDVDGNLQGIDFRPADGKLYGVTDTDKIYTINPNTGTAKLVCTLSTSFDGGFQSGMDWNPQVNRLRLVGSNDQSFSVGVPSANDSNTCDVVVNGNLNPPDPNVTAAAYTNSRANAPSTLLYDIDYDSDMLVLQNPTTGTLTPVGSLGVNFDPIGGFDIFTNASGRDTAFALSGSTLYRINLGTGAADRMGNMRNASGFIGLAVTVRQR